MSVYTTVTPEQLSEWLKRYSLGTLVELKGIASGIENTNYFMTTTSGRYVLTLFEKLTREELPFYINLTSHLDRHGIPCPGPIADLNNQFLGELNGKPACVVIRLAGASVDLPTPGQCRQVGAVLANMHLSGNTYPGRMPNPRGPEWWLATAPSVAGFLDAADAEMLRNELQFQARFRFENLPRGVIHADLFRDNVLFDGDQLGGLIDFYFACNDVLLYDVAITVNDWCLNDDYRFDPDRLQAFLRAYHAVRPFSDEEFADWPAMLRGAALRFWLSRLYDKHYPRDGELTKTKDPNHFRNLLRHHVEQPGDLRALVC